MPKSLRDWKKRCKFLEERIAKITALTGVDPDKAADGGADSTELQKKIAELENQKLYDQAEMENIRKRAIKERSEIIRYSGEKVLLDLLDVEDNFARALEHAGESDKDTLLKGLQMIKGSLEKILEKNEVAPIDCLGKVFDPNEQEAISMSPADGREEGTVLAVAQTGYRFKDKILRPARVVVVSNPKK